MPANTPLRGYTYPTPDDPNDLSFITQRLAEQVEADMVALIGDNPNADTGWLDQPLNSSFVLYTTGVACVARRAGRFAEVRGVVSPANSTAAAAVAGTGTTTDNLILTLPAEFRPNATLTYVMQASGMARWALSLTSAGNLYAGRYGTAAPSTTSWMPFNASWIIG